ncbi:hypothetical protein BDY21DRAFT_2750 [Lineolata rhizophorae]|uniref:Uncharacterized protein n=1 Tax=Lineolata rhizophorae TaxID=578093 RepID=A0A6A6PDI3_9PEZI|nr:hypothetical protein BDY21DRAFT_2750 [Lineolata rhizophorae]
MQRKNMCAKGISKPNTAEQALSSLYTEPERSSQAEGRTKNKKASLSRYWTASMQRLMTRCENMRMLQSIAQPRAISHRPAVVLPLRFQASHRHTQRTQCNRTAVRPYHPAVHAQYPILNTRHPIRPLQPLIRFSYHHRLPGCRCCARRGRNGPRSRRPRGR